jgi:hypothetical protein
LKADLNTAFEQTAASTDEASARPQSALEPGLPSDAFSDGSRFRILAIVDDFTRECLVLVADTSMPGLRIVRDVARGRSAMIAPTTAPS